jgi:hypothetical protein
MTAGMQVNTGERVADAPVVPQRRLVHWQPLAPADVLCSLCRRSSAYPTPSRHSSHITVIRVGWVTGASTYRLLKWS